MICREVPLATLSFEAKLLLSEQVDVEKKAFAEGALATLRWIADPDQFLAPHECLLAGRTVPLQ